jgi:shikimate 5-dehydrogenase
MNFYKLLPLALVFVALAVTLVQADKLQDEIDAALKKFCGGIAVTAPTKSQTFTNAKKIKVTVSNVSFQAKSFFII